MPISLPLDVIDSILSCLCGTASIAECALVCHSWLPSARYHLLPQPKALRLDQVQIAKFLRLIDSPKSTLSLVTFNKLDLAQIGVEKFDRNNPLTGDDWRSEVAVRDLLAKDLISFRSVTSLSLGWINWRTLSPPAVTSLHSNFTSVKELKLRCISFTLPELCRLLAALTALEKLTVDNWVPYLDQAPSTIDTVQISHPSLCHLAFVYRPRSWVVQYFARAIQYPSGITSVLIETCCTSKDLEAYGKLLETAGANLRALKLRVFKIDPLSPGTDRIYSELLAFAHNTNLQEIDFDSIEESTVMPFLQGLKMKPKLSRLRLELNEPDDLEKWTGGPLVDEVLSAMVLKDPKLIVDLPPLYRILHYESEVLEPLEKAYVEKFFERLKKMLPRTIQYWTLEVGIQSPSKFQSLRSTPHHQGL